MAGYLSKPNQPERDLPFTGTSSCDMVNVPIIRTGYGRITGGKRRLFVTEAKFQELEQNSADIPHTVTHFSRQDKSNILWSGITISFIDDVQVLFDYCNTD